MSTSLLASPTRPAAPGGAKLHNSKSTLVWATPAATACSMRSGVQVRAAPEAVLPDYTLDEVLSSMPPAANDETAPKPRTKRPQQSPGPSNSQAAAFSKPTAAARLARMLKAAKEKSSQSPSRGETSSTSGSEEATRESAKAHAVIEGTQSQEWVPPDINAQPTTAVTHVVPLMQPAPRLQEVQEELAPIQTTLRRRSRLFNLQQPVSVPSPVRGASWSAANAAMQTSQQQQWQQTQPPPPQQPRPSTDAQAALRAGSTSRAGSGIAASQATDLVCSTRQPRRTRRRQPSPLNITPAGVQAVQAVPGGPFMGHAASTQRVLRQQSHARQPHYHQAVATSSTWPVPPLVGPPGRVPGSANMTPLTASSREVTQGNIQRGPSNLAQVLVPSSHQSANRTLLRQQQQQQGAAVDEVPISMHTWQAVASWDWPQVYSPGYHTSLFEFLLDVWLEAAKALESNRPVTAQLAFHLLQHCWQSPEQLVRHSAVLALAEALPSSEVLQRAVASSVQPIELLRDALLPMTMRLFPDELHIDGSLHEFITAANARLCQAAQPAQSQVSEPNIGPYTEQDACIESKTSKRSRKRASTSLQTPSTSTVSSLKAASSDSSAVHSEQPAGAHGRRRRSSSSQAVMQDRRQQEVQNVDQVRIQGTDEWQQLFDWLLETQKVYPAVALAPLITLLDSSE